MSESYRHNDFAFWGLILFVFTIVHLAFVLSNSAGKQDQTYAEKQCTEQQLRHAQSRAKSNVKSVQPLTADKRADQTDNEQKGEPDWCDLAAQQSMANSTRRAEQAAWSSTILTVVAVILLGFTLLYTARTLDEARQTTNASLKMVRANRAWMTNAGSITIFIQGGLVEKVHSENGVGFQIRWKNTGHSPALNVTVFAKHKLIELNERIPVFTKPEPRELKKAIVGPGYVVSSEIKALNDDNTEKLRSRKVRLFIYSYVGYRDIHEQNLQRHTEFCAEITYSGEQDDGRGTLVPHYNFSPIGPQNTTS